MSFAMRPSLRRCLVGARRGLRMGAAASARPQALTLGCLALPSVFLAGGLQGRFSAARCASGADGSEAGPLRGVVRVVPYGVLGSSSAGSKASPPDAETAFVDPAGMHHIQGSPGNAGGAAGVIYKWLGIAESPTFPAPVVQAITGALKAKFHAYGGGEKKCIHVVGPDFRKREYTREEAVGELTEAYFNVLREFCGAGLYKLRLLPVSGGIFSGPFKGELPKLTAEALEAALGRLSATQRSHLQESSLEMCIFMESEVADFEAALQKTSAL